MSIMIAGYIILATPRGRQSGTMAYGLPYHPSPDLLMLGRGSTRFDTENDAWEAVKVSMKRCDDLGHTWQKNCSLAVIELRNAPKVAETVSASCGDCSSDKTESINGD